MLTDRVTGKPKGIAFVDFDGSVDLEGAMSLHHTNWKARRINVELTAGGGGHKSEARKGKIKAKNEKFAKDKMAVRSE